MADLPYSRTVLSNGVRLILIPVAGVNSVATSVMVGVGSRYEDPRVNGISHFLEHLVFKGTKKYPTMDDVNVIERIGGLQNAYTDIDITNYHNKVLSTDWELALDVNKELAIAAKLDEVHVDKERSIIIEELKRYEDEPSAKVGEAFHELLYPGTKLGRPIIGSQESLARVNSDELKHYRDAWYKPTKIVVVVAGKIKSQKSKGKNEDQRAKIQERVAEWFGHLEGNPVGDIEVVKDHQTKPAFAVVTKPDAQQAHLTLGVRTFARTSHERFAWAIFNLLMGVSFTSRLFKEIREKRGLCYHIRSSSDAWADVGYWSIYAGVATDKVEETIRAVLVELALAVEKGVTDEEVKVAKKRLKTMVSFKSEDPEFINEFYGRQEIAGEPIITLDDYLDKIDAVTKKEIDQLVRKYIKQATLNLTVVWNKKRDEKLVKLLKL